METISLHFLLIILCLRIFYYQPNAVEVYIDEKEVWNCYKSDPLMQSHEKVYGYDTFTRTFATKVKIHQYKNVIGKCDVCGACKNLMTQSKSKALR